MGSQARSGGTRFHRIVSAYRRHCFAGLFVSLLLTLGAGSTLEVLAPHYNPLQVLMALNLVAAIASIERRGEAQLILWIGVGFLATRALRAALGIPHMLPLSEGLWVMGIVLTTLAAARHALRRGSVDAERIFAALDAYLLVGLLFGVAYWVVDGVWPGSFGGTAPGSLPLRRAIYFSFVTMATLGYGDVVPLSEPAQGLAIVEAVSGQMYLAVLVARLVSLYSQERDA